MYLYGVHVKVLLCKWPGICLSISWCIQPYIVLCGVYDHDLVRSQQWPEAAVDLLECCLKLKWKERITARQALDHPFFKIMTCADYNSIDIVDVSSDNGCSSSLTFTT
jgi:serine/threonine protein kinase